MPTSPRRARRRGPHRAAVSFRASDRCHWLGNPFPAPAGAASPPSAREVSTRSVDGGREKKKTGGAEPRPYTRLPKARALYPRRDEVIAPYKITGGVCVIRTGGAEPRPYARFPGDKIISNRRPLAATYLCRFAAKARFDNRQPLGGCFQRGRAAALPLWSLKDGGFSRGKEDRNFLPP